MSERWSDADTPLAVARRALAAFNAERDWEQFHTPKDLAMCLAAEAGELLEPFLWKRTDDALDRAAISEELADVVICALNLAARLDIDVMRVVQAKIGRNALRYPAAVARGRADKYTMLPDPEPSATGREESV